MLPVIPDVLKQNRDTWYFSEEEPWKPIAKEDAPDAVKTAIAEFISVANGENS